MIRPATLKDLPRIKMCALEFCQRSRFLNPERMERFESAWQGLLESGAGAIFVFEDQEGIQGILGGVVYPELYSGDLIATEFYWYVREGFRGQGMKLYRAFEAWAKAMGCTQIRMVHLMDSMPEKLERVYQHLGFTAAEVHYTKDLQS